MAKILYLTLKNDLDLILLPLKICSLVRCTCTPNIKCISILDQMLWPKLKWTTLPIFFSLTLNDDLDLNVLPITMYGLMWYTFLPNIKSLSVMAQKLWPMLKLYSQNSIFDLWPWRMTLTLYLYHSKCAASWDAPVHQISNVHLYWIKCYGKSESGLFYLYILPLTLKNDLDLDILPLKRCGLRKSYGQC